MGRIEKAKMADKVEASKGKVDRKQRRLEYWKKNKKQRTQKADSSTTPTKDEAVNRGKKRKTAEGESGTPQKKKKKKVQKEESLKKEAPDNKVAANGKENKGKGFILFVGSLPADS